ncbi:MAG: phosphatase PAP2 family protein [Solirubrobacteraceae bacterium]
MSRGIRATAWALVVAGAAAPALRRRMQLRPVAVLGSAGLAPVALCIAAPRSRWRELAVCGLNMWAYMAAYELPHDDPQRLAARAHVDYPIALDRALGLGVPPTVRLQQAYAREGSISRFERVLVWCHWSWFMVPHATLAYVLLRDGNRFPASAARMYSVFDLGAVFYWALPTAPPWWAASHGRLDDRVGDRRADVGGEVVAVRRLMIEYGEQFWGERWAPLYDVFGGNPLAAMPSLHFATSLMAAHLLSEVGPIAGGLGWTYTMTLGLALVYLGEHYAVDVLAGAALTEAIRLSAPAITPPARRFARTLAMLQAHAAVV